MKFLLISFMSLMTLSAKAILPINIQDYAINNQLLIQVAHQHHVKTAKLVAQELYRSNPGLEGVRDQLITLEGGRECLYLNISGLYGNCCFNSLGVSREELLGRIEEYINQMDGKFQNRTDSLKAYGDLIGITYAYIDLINDGQIEDCHFESISRKVDTLIHSGKFVGNEAFLQQSRDDIQQLNEEKAKAAPDLGLAYNILSEFMVRIDTSFSELRDLNEYQAFLQAIEGDFWKAVGDDNFLKTLDTHFRTFQSEWKEKQTEFNPDWIKSTKIRLDPEQVEYINLYLGFSRSIKDEKIRRLRRFYNPIDDGGMQRWMDISSLSYIADKLNIKFQVYQRMDRHPYQLAVSSVNWDTPGKPDRRYLHRSGGRFDGHFDLLFPIMPDL